MKTFECQLTSWAVRSKRRAHVSVTMSGGWMERQVRARRDHAQTTSSASMADRVTSTCSMRRLPVCVCLASTDETAQVRLPSISFLDSNTNNFTVFSASVCDDFDCHGNGRCVVLHSGDAACVCDDSRWTHNEDDGASGFCANEQCSDDVTCENGGHCTCVPSAPNPPSL